MLTHPDIALMIASCNKPAADLLQLVRFWLCIKQIENWAEDRTLWNSISEIVGAIDNDKYDLNQARTFPLIPNRSANLDN